MRRSLASLALLVSTSAALGACSAAGTNSPDAASSIGPSAISSATIVEPSPTTPAGPQSPPPGEPNPSPAPSSTLGLTQASLPRPALLGRGWSYRVDPGGAEAGYSGNGTPAMARDPQEVGAGIWPLGCTPPATLPTLPKAALEVDYKRSAPTSVGVALLLKFATPAAATAFFTAYTDTIRTCATSGGKGAPQITLVHLATPSQFGSIRRDPDSDPDNPVWTEGVTHTGTTMLLVTVATADPATGSPWKALS